jgi:hypothetical protein
MAKKGYTNESKIENYLLQDIHSSFSTQIDSWIEGVEKIIDKITGRNFIADSTASARLYDGDGSTELLIDEAIAITKVEVGNDSYGANFTEVVASGADRYFLKPDNYAAKELPVHKIILNARTFTSGIQNNRVTAKWGYSAAVPADIEFAATVFVAGIINQHRQGGDEIKSEKIGNYQVTYNTDDKSNSYADFVRAQEILKAYTKINI